ncbi:MAG TPA: NAD-dependent epimerase/dehydratase family protein [Herpetosiphonaceae bacterium]
MKLLILGGTVFLGRALAEQALARGHEVTLFNRGQHSPELFPEAEKLRGDRGGDLDALKGRRWDAAIDTSGYIPRAVRATAELLADAVEHYAFVSSISVYADSSEPGMDESAPVGTLADPAVEEVTGETYGPLKALCEQAAEQAMPGRALIARPGLIVGPHDPTDRFTYWIERVGRGGPFLAPEPPSMSFQVIDVRDLAAWLLDKAEERHAGVYHLTGPAERLSMAEFLDLARAELNPAASPVWVSEQFVLEQGVAPWMELPLWLPVESDPSNRGLMEVSIAKALGAGLKLRPVAETIRDTAAWAAGLPADRQRRAGLAPEREQELLRLWRERDAAP